MLKTILIGIASLLFIVVVGGYFLYDHTESGYQKWADCTRVNDLYYIAGIVEEFKSKTGYYPLGYDYWKPVEDGYVYVQTGVNITHRELPERYRRVPLGVSGSLLTTEDFIEELSSGLGREIKLPSDPQNVATWAPNFYQYNIHPDGNYVLSASLYSPNEFTRKLGEHYFKYSVGSLENKNPNARVLNFLSLNVKPHKCPR